VSDVINIMYKKTSSLKQCNCDTSYITQLKQQKSKRCYYVGSTTS